MFSEQLMKYILSYQKDEYRVQENKQKPTSRTNRIRFRKKYATVPIRYTK